MYEKVLVLHIFSECRSIVCGKNQLIFDQVGVRCLKKYLFYEYIVMSVNFCEKIIGFFFLNKENVISRVGRWRGNRQTDTHSLMVWEEGGGERREEEGCLEGFGERSEGGEGGGERGFGEVVVVVGVGEEEWTGTGGEGGGGRAN